MPYSTGIEGLDIILGHSDFPPDEAEKGFRLLIRGVPGTGKTTLGLHLINHQLSKASTFDSSEEKTKGLIIYLQEEIKSMDRLSALFKLDFKKSPPDTARVSVGEYKKKFPFIKSWIRKQIDNHDKKVKLCVFIDGLSLAQSIFDSSQTMHDFILRLLTELPCENLFLIIATEDNLLTNDNFSQHLVDCVIDLTISANIQRHRFLEIKKCRYIDYFRGKHGFEMYQRDNEKSTLQVYPSPGCHLLLARKKNEYEKNQEIRESLRPTISSGIINLEKIISGSSDYSGNILTSGDSFVITAEPGTDKIGFGLSFLSAIFSEKDAVLNQKSLWLSFGYSSLYRLLSFQTYKKRFPHLYDDYTAYNTAQAATNFTEIYRKSIAMHPDKILFQLIEYLSQNKENIIRIAIDGINNIGREFDDPKKTTEYMFMLTRILRYFNVVGIIFLELSRNLQSLNDIPMEWAEEADFIGHLGQKEVENSLIQTFMLTKSRYSNFSTRCYQVENNESGTIILK